MNWKYFIGFVIVICSIIFAGTYVANNRNKGVDNGPSGTTDVNLSFDKEYNITTTQNQPKELDIGIFNIDTIINRLEVTFDKSLSSFSESSIVKIFIYNNDAKIIGFFMPYEEFNTELIVIPIENLNIYKNYRISLVVEGDTTISKLKIKFLMYNGSSTTLIPDTTT
jgi:hypothetical protein